MGLKPQHWVKKSFTVVCGHIHTCTQMQLFLCSKTELRSWFWQPVIPWGLEITQHSHKLCKMCLVMWLRDYVSPNGCTSPPSKRQMKAAVLAQWHSFMKMAKTELIQTTFLALASYQLTPTIADLLPLWSSDMGLESIGYHRGVYHFDPDHICDLLTSLLTTIPLEQWGDGAFLPFLRHFISVQEGCCTLRIPTHLPSQPTALALNVASARARAAGPAVGLRLREGFARTREMVWCVAGRRGQPTPGPSETSSALRINASPRHAWF